MIFSCDKRVDCEGSDFPLLNASSEGPDLPQFNAVGFCCNGQQAWAFSLASQQDANDALQRLMVQNCPSCVEPRVYCADATCPDGSLLATYCLPTTQAEADALAEAHREAMLPFCDAKDELFSATCACPDGSQPVTMYSEISEEDAMAACESVPRDCFPPCNEEQICRVVCPDGTEFYYVVPACTIYAATVAEANTLAYALACQRAAELRICLGPIDPCTCYGDPYSSTINATGTTSPPALWEIVSSNLPPGLSATLTADGYGLVISGHPTSNGAYTFSVKATTANGSYAIKSYSISVLQITTTALPNFSAGVAYSYQLAAAGGSGNYAWRLVSGTLPDGISLSISGLLTGTPTGSAVAATLIFDVIDQACEVVSRGFYPPKVKLQTNATTRLQIKRGYPEYVASTGALYKKIAWTGSIIQRGQIAATLESIGGAKFIYTGATEIDIEGNFLSHHEKNMYVACNPAHYPDVAEGPNAAIAVLSPALYWSQSRIHKMIGYCYEPDWAYCPVCSDDEDTWVFRGNYAVDSANDPAEDVLINPNGFIKTPTSMHYASSASGEFAITNINNWSVVTGQNSGTALITATGDYTATLSEPFTDAEAVASQKTYNSALAYAENLPDYLRTTTENWLVSVYSRFTDVTYSLKCTNLVIGQTYILRFRFQDSDGTISNESTTFVATDYAQIITGTVPTPAVGHRINIENASISYAI